MSHSSLRSLFFTDTATTEIYTLSLHDALPISQAAVRLLLLALPRRRARRGARGPQGRPRRSAAARAVRVGRGARPGWQDRKSTRLNSSHVRISYAVFCLKKKKQNHKPGHAGWH